MNGTPDQRIDLRFEDNRLLPLLYGQHDEHLARVERQLGVSLISRGNMLTIAGPPESAEAARSALNALYERLRHGMEVGTGEVDAAVRMATVPEDADARGHVAEIGLRHGVRLRERAGRMEVDQDGHQLLGELGRSALGEQRGEEGPRERLGRLREVSLHAREPLGDDLGRQ